jgi:hypothetical protein
MGSFTEVPSELITDKAPLIVRGVPYRNSLYYRQNTPYAKSTQTASPFITDKTNLILGGRGYLNRINPHHFLHRQVISTATFKTFGCSAMTSSNPTLYTFSLLQLVTFLIQSHRLKIHPRPVFELPAASDLSYSWKYTVPDI